jgi:TolB-like protein
MTVLPPQLPEEPALNAEQRRALEILSTAGLHGCTGTALFARGLTIDMLAELVRDGLATARRETLKVGKRKVTIARVWIAEAGKRALEG